MLADRLYFSSFPISAQNGLKNHIWPEEYTVAYSFQKE